MKEWAVDRLNGWHFKAPGYLTLLVPPINTFIIHTKNKKYVFDKVESILFQMKPKLFTIHYNCV
jgi:hypothetical protein